MKKLRKYTSIILSLILGVGIGLGTGYFVFGRDSEATDVEQSRVDLKLPGETEKRKVTKQEVESELVAIEEISSYEGKYEVTKVVDESRYLFDYAVPGTKNSIEIKCNGIVKVGYDFDDITITVDNISRKIYISLPEPKVNDNYIIMDTVQCTENNSILNPINFEQYKIILTELEELGLNDVKSKGIFKDAESNIKKLIKNTLYKFDESEIIYM